MFSNPEELTIQDTFSLNSSESPETHEKVLKLMKTHGTS